MSFADYTLRVLELFSQSVPLAIIAVAGAIGMTIILCNLLWMWQARRSKQIDLLMTRENREANRAVSVIDHERTLR